MFGATAVSDVELVCFFACTLLIFYNFYRIVNFSFFISKNVLKLFISFFITLCFYTCFKLRNYRWSELYSYITPYFTNAFEKIADQLTQQLRSHASSDEL